MLLNFLYIEWITLFSSSITSTWWFSECRTATIITCISPHIPPSYGKKKKLWELCNLVYLYNATSSANQIVLLQSENGNVAFSNKLNLNCSMCYSEALCSRRSLILRSLPPYLYSTQWARRRENYSDLHHPFLVPLCQHRHPHAVLAGSPTVSRHLAPEWMIARHLVVQIPYSLSRQQPNKANT